ncbi:hypothetical protein B0H19DRAFT_1159778 [Mycena capillaripes]|nr:hypothetical protein B0H19DRAFT_1159778 [Mycena capillaripes]
MAPILLLHGATQLGVILSRPLRPFRPSTPTPHRAGMTAQRSVDCPWTRRLILILGVVARTPYTKQRRMDIDSHEARAYR